MMLHFFILVFGIFLSTVYAQTNLTYPFPGSLKNASVYLTGVNLASAGFTTQDDGTGNNIREVPTKEDANAWLNLKFNFIRYSFNWRFFQPDPSSGNDFTQTPYYQRTISNITTLTQLGAFVNIDCHMYNRFDNNQVIGEDGPSAAQFANMWRQIATDLQNNTNIIFGLMNEPHNENIGKLASTMQEAVIAIRDAGAEQYILLPCTEYSGLSQWSSCEPMMSNVNDTLNKLIYDLHSYFDKNRSGESGDCLSFDNVKGSYEEVTSILRSKGRHAILSEFGGEPSYMCNKTVNDALTFLNENSDVWLGWTAWGALLNGPDSESKGEGSPDKLYLDPDPNFKYPDTNISNSSFNLVRDALLPHKATYQYVLTSSASSFSSTSSVTTSTLSSCTAPSASSSNPSSQHSASCKSSKHNLYYLLILLLIPIVGALYLCLRCIVS